ncbi:B3 domain-containing protein Os03g0619600-like [Phragmites australis]|uniref:B3 domain-containing protein Os03g0619600-like n=1 Tax=Phragmites australis TaxID=29695 RepID=UPI002D77AC47|nr:B3 domain-containing protein Os03g0619600-like [Phragmites australis]XP_062209352.1 B3 domain-containing protein Os03g0619600-like [Phragmites australis]
MARTRTGGSRTKKKSCDCCKRYLDHLDEKNQNMNYFLRRMTVNSKCSMIVPNRFLNHFAGKLSGTIKLKSPNGSLYDVEITERFNKVVLRHGWEAFVDAHHIEENDFLLFRHIEKSCFEVLILDSDGCEKVFSCTGIQNTSCFKERSVDSVDISSSSHHKTTDSSESERFSRYQKGSSCPHGKTAKMGATSSSSEESGEDIPSENKYFESDDLQIPLGADYVLSQRSYLSKAQKARVIALIQEIQPESTVFVAIMRKSHVQPPSPCLAISKEYAFAHFPHESTNVTLQRPGKSKKWHPEFYKRKDISMYMLRGQWLDFVHDNHVQEEDICLLLPTKGGRRFTFVVYLLRATASHARNGIGYHRTGSWHGRSSTKMASAVHIKEEPTDEEHVSSESDKHGSHKSLENKDFGGPSEPPYILPCKSRLSQSQKKIVEEKVRAIKCEVPIYVAIMNKSSVNHRHELELGARYAAANLPYRRQTVVLRCRSKTWKTQMVIRNGSRWFLSGGWSTFVRDNSLQVGDICLFELKKNERKLTMTIHIILSEQF